MLDAACDRGPSTQSPPGPSRAIIRRLLINRPTGVIRKNPIKIRKVTSKVRTHWRVERIRYRFCGSQSGARRAPLCWWHRCGLRYRYPQSANIAGNLPQAKTNWLANFRWRFPSSRYAKPRPLLLPENEETLPSSVSRGGTPTGKFTSRRDRVGRFPNQARGLIAMNVWECSHRRIRLVRVQTGCDRTAT